MTWYELNKSKPFDFAHEILKYTISDVAILMEGMLRFRELFLEISKTKEYPEGLEIFSDSVTVASACSNLLRQNFLIPKTIGKYIFNQTFENVSF